MAASTGLRLALALRDPSPWIFQDEIGYAELARNFALEGRFGIRDGDTGGFGLLYPLLISPAFALFSSAPDAYDLIRAINALLISLTAVPAYLLARLVAGRGLSIAAAMLATGTFSMAYANVVMTENAFYPAVTATACAMAYALARPTLVRQLLVFAIVAVAFAVRVQAVVLVAAFGTAIVLVVVADAVRARGDRLRAAAGSLLAYRVSLGLMLGGGLAIVSVQSARGASWNDILRGYAPVTESQYDLRAVADWFLYHVAELDLATGIFPFVALLLCPVLALRRDVPRELAVLSSVALAVVLWFSATVAAYASHPGAARIEERNLFHVVPVLFAVFSAWLALGLPRPLVPTTVAALVAGLLPVTIPFARFLDATAVHSTMSLLPTFRLSQETGIPQISVVVGVLGLAAAATVLLLPRRLLAVLPLAVLAYFAIGTPSVEQFTHRTSLDARALALGGQRLDWIDEHAVDGDAVQIVSGTNGYAFWVNEFFNNSITRVYNLAGRHDSFAQQTITPEAESGVLRTPDGEPVSAAFAQTTRWVELRGEVAEQDETTGVTLWKTRAPLAMTQQVDGVYDDLWSGVAVVYRRFDCVPGTVEVTLLSDRNLFPSGQTVAVAGAPVSTTLRVPPSDEKTVFRVPVTPLNGRCDLTFTPAPTAVPPGDPRTLGVRFLSIDFRAGR